LTSLKICVDNSFSRFIGEIPVFLDDAFYNLLSYKIEGAEFSRVYNRHWDGVKRLYRKKTHTFPTGLLDRALQYLKGIEVSYETIYPHPPTQKSVPFHGILRDYQKHDLDKVSRFNVATVQWPTGTGKSILMGALLAKLGVTPAVVLVHTVDLMYQNQKFIESLLHVKCGLIGNGQWNPQPITIAILQTLHRGIVDKDKVVMEYIKSVKTMLVDETHHISAQTFFDVSERMENAYYRYGFSATPWRDDGHDLLIEAACGPKRIVRTISDMIEAGYLVPPKIYFLPVQHTKLMHGSKVKELTDKEFNAFVKDKDKPYGWVYKYWISKNLYFSELVVRCAGDLVSSVKPVLILVKHLEQGHMLVELFKQLYPHLRTTFLEGEIKGPKRQEILEDVKKGKIDLLIATPLADEGLDFPIVKSMVIANVGVSSVKTYQRVGRVLRPHEGKKEAIVIEFDMDVKYLRRHCKRRREIYLGERKFVVRKLTHEDVQQIILRRDTSTNQLFLLPQSPDVLRSQTNCQN